ncbi:hypothetical protein QQG74_09560 [Micromonospora sp. FIMYZ51]|uniref:peptidoglycan-binding domain-containing protein n=1 Tax=Micromonospora sp. FIMYZ51 TaxID=3051832 RepID=UPI00311FCACC
MATLVSDPIRYLADQWENHCGYPSAVLSGIVPDQRHLDQGGFHCSVEDLRRFGNQNDYSNTRPDDKDWNVRYGAAVDMSMSPADMKRTHDRVRKAWADLSDPRRPYINAINTWSGSGDAVRLDFYANTAKYASPDHKWHNHGEMRRRWLLNMTAAKAIVSVLKGETKQQYLASTADSGGSGSGEGGDDVSRHVRHGDNSEAVKDLQFRLNRLGIKTVHPRKTKGQPGYGTREFLTVDGGYQDHTAEAVRAFERQALGSDYKGDGRAVLAATWTRLDDAYWRQLIVQHAPKPQPAAAPTVDYTQLAARVDVAQVAARVDHPTISGMLVRDPDLLQRLVTELVRELTAQPSKS